MLSRVVLSKLHKMAESALKILHVSDIHSALDKVEQLKEWLIRRNQKVDIILLSGDIANMPMEYDLPEEETDKYYKDMEAVISSVSSIQSNMYYIPGNHDPITSFAKETCLAPPATPSLPYNVDKKFVYIAPSLCVAGFGGSIPAFLRNGEKFWNSFPYKTVEEYEKALKDVTDGLFEQDNVLQPNDALILMTHSGPNDSGTTLETRDVTQPVVSGSDGLLQSLKTPKAQKHCVLNIHGHTHASCGRTIIGNVSVSNCGSLMEHGRFAIYEFDKEPWRLSSLSYHTL